MGDAMTTAASRRSSPGVVAGVDGSENARSAAEWAAREALARGVPLTLLHALDLRDVSVLEPSEFALRSRDDGRAVLDRVVAHVKDRFPGLRVEPVLSDLSPFEALYERSQSHPLLVTGTRGRGGFPGMSLGSVSRKLAAHAQCPLVVVPNASGSPGSPGGIVVGICAGQADAPLAFAFDAAERYGTPLFAARAWWPHRPRLGPDDGFPAHLGRVHGEKTVEVEELLEPFRVSHPHIDVEIMAWRGNTVPVLVEAARDSRLLVVGAHRHRGPLAVGAGYVVDGVLARAPVPVAVVPIAPPTVKEPAQERETTWAASPVAAGGLADEAAG
jgi:nucleotide-binding universal stress UspA family protein